jgi:hypothetical protein
MKRIFFLFLVLCCAQRSDAVDAGADSVTSAEENRAQKAMLRSLVLPGWGQFYNGKKWKGSFIAALEVGSAVGYVVRRQQIKNAITPERNWFMISTIGLMFYSMADAYVDAHLDRVNWADIQTEIREDGMAHMQLQFKFK